MNISLLVYYVENIEESKGFYEKLGLEFVEEKHGSGPVHYFTKVDETIFEIYPKGEAKQITRMRIGLDLSKTEVEEPVVEFIESVSNNITTFDNGQKYVVVRDPNNNNVEIVW